LIIGSFGSFGSSLELVGKQPVKEINIPEKITKRTFLLYKHIGFALLKCK
jgi:hypothetical protein